MVAYEPEPLVSEFARRTALNQQLVDAVAAAEERLKPEDRWAHEFTQLVNSLFGLLILPHEHGWLRSLKGGFEAIGLLIENGEENPIRMWSTSGQYGERTAQNLVRRIRNAISHDHVIPIAENGELVSVRFKDRLNEDSPFHTEIVLTKHELRNIVEKLLGVMQQPKEAE